MEINERFIKLSSRLPYGDAIELGQDVSMQIGQQFFIANCVKIEYEDQQDGKVNAIYKLKFTAE